MRLARVCALVLCYVLAAVLGYADDAKPLTPEEAAKKVGEKVTVEMEVKSTGKSKGVYFLNSKADFKDKDNFTLFVGKEGAASLLEAKVEDPSTHFKGKTVRVTGTVKLYREKPE